MLPEEIKNKWDVVLEKDKWEIYKYLWNPLLETNAIAKIILDCPDIDKDFDELLAEGKSFKEINKIMKGK